jgi:adenylate kinase
MILWPHRQNPGAGQLREPARWQRALPATPLKKLLPPPEAAYFPRMSAPANNAAREKPKPEAVLLLGPTGSGKTPLGEWLERASLRGRRCHHFDFGANLRAVVAGEAPGAFTAEEIRFLRRVLEQGALLEDEHFPLAARILDTFAARQQIQAADLIVLNGLPRHLDQARAVDRKLKIIGLIQLECAAHTVAERLRRDTGGDRGGRTDDTESLVARKLAIYEARTRFLLRHYREQGVPVLKIETGVRTQPAELARRLETGPGLPGS